MSDYETFAGSDINTEMHGNLVCRIQHLADKYGVARSTVLIAISLAGGNLSATEEILRGYRFCR